MSKIRTELHVHRGMGSASKASYTGEWTVRRTEQHGAGAADWQFSPHRRVLCAYV